MQLSKCLSNESKYFFPFLDSFLDFKKLVSHVFFSEEATARSNYERRVRSRSVKRLETDCERRAGGRLRIVRQLCAAQESGNSDFMERRLMNRQKELDWALCH